MNDSNGKIPNFQNHIGIAKKNLSSYVTLPVGHSSAFLTLNCDNIRCSLRSASFRLSSICLFQLSVVFWYVFFISSTSPVQTQMSPPLIQRTVMQKYKILDVWGRKRLFWVATAFLNRFFFLYSNLFNFFLWNLMDFSKITITNIWAKERIFRE